MILKIPFFPGEKYYCAQDCALMVLKYFFPEKEFYLEEIGRRSGKHQEFGTMTVGLAKALKEFGLKVDFYYKNEEGEEMSKEDKKSFLEKYGNFLEQERETKKEAKERGVNFIEKDFSLEEVEKEIEKKRTVITLVNWNVFAKKESYQGHFIILTGFDKEHIYFHNPGHNFPEENAKERKERMEKARSYPGTNKETIIAYL